MTLQEHTAKKPFTGIVDRRVEPLPVAVPSSSSAVSSSFSDVATDRPGVPQHAPPTEAGGEREGSCRGKKRRHVEAAGTPPTQTAEERRLRKNSLARLRALRLRTNLAHAKQQPGWSTAERERLGKLEEQRQQKNERSAERHREKKQALERILATPPSLRSDRQWQTLAVARSVKEKKNAGDRVRRERIQREKKRIRQEKGTAPPPKGRPPKHRPMSPPTVGPAPRPPPAIPPFAAPSVGPAQMPLPTIPPFEPIFHTSGGGGQDTSTNNTTTPPP
mmetsp:Transcript_3177/g.6569  ORF Transcript_3177/g.6569 Transcript_3177/m.6569 type:complete len:276 (-) Transcript_3177:395-1222(-)